MRGIYIKLGYSLAIIAILIACTKQVGLVTEVEFDLSENYTSEGYVNEPLATTLTVVPEELIEGYIYDYRYAVLNGEGHFEDANGEEVPQGERRPFDPLSKSLNYIGSTVGAHTVSVQATDTYGFTEELELTYILSEVPVTWTATISDSELLVGDQTTVTVTLGNEGTGNATYERNYSISTGSGALTQSDGTGVGLDGYEGITPGTYQYGFVPDVLGTVTLTFDLRDSNGQELTASVNLEVVEELSSGENDILTFSIPDQSATSLIDDQAHTVTVTVPMGTTLTTAPTVLTVSEGATVTPAMATQQDFTSSVIYTVTAENGDGQEWTVTVIEEATSADPEITLIGGDITLTVGDTYVEEGATATDAEDGDISGDIVIDASAVDTNTVGSYQVTYNITDSGGNAATEVIRTVTVNAVANEPPTATDFSVSVLSNSTDNSIDVYDHIADAENDPLTITIADGSPANGTATISGTVISYTPNNGYTGNDVITYLVDDGNNVAVSATITVTVSDNASPEITLIGGDMTLTVGDTYIEEGATAMDAEDLDISGDIVIDASAVDTNTAGSYQVTYNVTDSDGNPATEVLRTVTVNAVVNEAPTAVSIANSTGGTAPLTVEFNNSGSSDPDGSIVLTNWDFGDGSSGNTGGFPRTVSHTFSAPGTYTVTLTVTDDGTPALSGTVTNIITVTAANQAPTAVDDDFMVSADGTLNGSVFLDNGNGVDSDADGDSIVVDQVNGSSLNVGVTINGSTGGQFTVTAGGNLSFDPNGDYDALNEGESALTNIQYQITDGNGGFDAATVTVTVTGVEDSNAAPTVSAGSDIVITLPMNSVTLNGSATDSDGTIQSYLWEKEYGGTATITDPSSASTMVTGLEEGEYEFRLTATDDDLASGTATVMVVVEASGNQEPTAVYDVYTVYENTTNNSLDVLDNDSDADVGDLLTITAIENPINGTASIGPGQQTILYNATTGNDRFDYTISDGNGGTSTATIDVNVIPNQSPTVEINELILIPSGDFPKTLDFFVSSSTDDGSIVDYEWNFDDFGSAGNIINNTDDSSVSHTFNASGTYNIVLTVTDNLGATGTDTVPIVLEEPLAPDFSFSANPYEPQPENGYSNPIDIYFNISPNSALSTGSYTMVMTTGKATIDIDGNPFREGIEIPMATGAVIGSFTDLLLNSEVSVTFTVTEGISGISKSRTLTLVY
ncbi:Ig-like domain-containing protein [Maribacter luteus]|uniref:DUF5011 domain-containing protein n=1 Tax=Maribacter luteus TaxID=2594478 RepID=A0A6I2MTW5_9FLAO|nr:PKD domain-containing protein [Maribacter luteus]MRX65950.1 DUF5011 domain-containing protein [Maribacter luteus]